MTVQLILTKELDSPSPPQPNPTFRSGSPRSLLAHEEFVDWLFSPLSPRPQVKKARFVLKTLLAKGYAQGTKSLVGDGKGWLRAALGSGTNGYGYYLWYATHVGEIGKSLNLGPNEIAIRIVREHDDNSLALNAGERENYLPISPGDIETATEEPAYTPQQVHIALNNIGTVQTIRGYPGSGKTTALLLAGEHAAHGKVLYITYSERLARDASEYFAAFHPEGVDIEVLTFDNLLNSISDDEISLFPQSSRESDATSFLEEVSKKINLVKEWSESPNELYAELHAHAVGAALPITFRGLTPCPTNALAGKKYHELRQDEIGKSLSQEASRIIEHAHKLGLFDKYFSAINRARVLLRDVNDPPPPRLLGATCILVDEVQDLTHIESLLLLNVIARIGTASGTLPRVILAGDESQTVRPTDFKWSSLNTLLTTVFGSNIKLEDISLEENLRSPLQIAKFVEATRSQYSILEKNLKPSGLTYTHVNDATIGRVIYCQLKDDQELDQVIELFGSIPQSCLIYPGYIVPPEIGADDEAKAVVFSSEDVKGLDFSLVGVLDAGQRQIDLVDLVSKGKGVIARTLGDQYRVAASRSSETLVLFDRGGNDRIDAIRSMCKDRVEIQLEVQDLEWLSQELSSSNPEELINQHIQDIRALFDNHPDRAFFRSKSVVKQFERLSHSGLVNDDLKQEVYRTRAVALLVGLLHADKFDRDDKEEIQTESKAVLQNIDMGDSYILVRDLALSKESWGADKRLTMLQAAAENINDLQIQIPEVFRTHEESLLNWLDQLAKRDVPGDDKRAFVVLDTAKSLVEKLLERHSYLENLTDKVRFEWADQLLESRKTFSLKLIQGAQVRDFKREGILLQSMKRFEESADAFELCGEVELAIDSLRQIPSLTRAIDLARSSGSATLSTLQWLESVKHMLDGKNFASNTQLTEAEHRELMSWAKSTRGGSDASVIPSQDFDDDEPF